MEEGPQSGGERKQGVKDEEEEEEEGCGEGGRTSRSKMKRGAGALWWYGWRNKVEEAVLDEKQVKLRDKSRQRGK